MTRMAMITALAMVVGCGGDGSDGPCTARSGLYRVKLTAQSGNCGAKDDEIVNADTPDQGCMGMQASSANMCTTTIDVTCDAGQGASAILRGKVSWNSEGTSGSGTVYIEGDQGGQAVCNGVYSVHYTKL